MQAINQEAIITECNLAIEPPDLDSLLGLRAFDLSKVLEAGSLFDDRKVSALLGFQISAFDAFSQEAACHIMLVCTQVPVDSSGAHLQHDHHHNGHGHSGGWSI